jgi:hypothetical protein
MGIGVCEWEWGCEEEGREEERKEISYEIKSKVVHFTPSL